MTWSCVIYALEEIVYKHAQRQGSYVINASEDGCVSHVDRKVVRSREENMEMVDAELLSSKRGFIFQHLSSLDNLQRGVKFDQIGTFFSHAPSSLDIKEMLANSCWNQYQATNCNIFGSNTNRCLFNKRAASKEWENTISPLLPSSCLSRCQSGIYIDFFYLSVSLLRLPFIYIHIFCNE